MNNNDKQTLSNDRIFFSDGYKLGQTAIAKGLTKQTLFDAIEMMYQAIDGLNDSLIALAQRQNIKISCSKGCYWCCHQPVFANSYEIHYLSGKIKKFLGPNKAAEFQKKAELKNSETSKLNENQVLNFKSSCPLLSEQGACSIYPARPVACRIYLSTSFPSCLEFFHHPESKSNYPELLDFPLRAGRMINEGFNAALKEAGIETTEFRLEEGLSIALKQ
jgi:Fe-S-cluster containining protein